ncbi:dihydrofolate reductase family protein [Kutzneria sp. CA-103260]|uniref:dihydrofolate reductase family protein n=1 Tax=Kutzneria sp. CA-103260 TaxID=2802641 RepID=UPI001BA4DC9B|nr:dihydrofolate reductase family protein [Kutzneria sp. CA-103260]QUQ62987.1 pyrimidine reductase [Kutzneria sp. CA-103260]
MARRIVATEYVSLDGFMDEPGAWSMPYFSDEAGAFKWQELQESEAMLLGRHTYEGFAAAWPTMTDTGEFGERMNSMPKHVLSRTLTTLTWNSTLVDGLDGIRKLVDGQGGDLLLAGSGQVFKLLAQHDLIDEYRFMIFPVILGDGQLPLFQPGPRRALKLVDTLMLPHGVIVHSYQRAS